MSKVFWLGVFIIGALAILAGGIFWIGSRQFLFTPTYKLNAEFQNVAGLNGGAEVRVGGIHEGTVRTIQLPLKPEDKVRIIMDMARPTREVIKKDSVATIHSEGLVGDKFVEISFGSGQAQKVNDGDTIAGAPPLQISDLIKKTDGILDSANGAVQNLDAAVDNVKDITGKINEGQGTIGALVNDKKVYHNVNAGANAFQENMEAMKHNFLLRGFYKNRGYENSTDLKKNAISKLPDKSPDKKFDYDAKQIFDKPDNAKLKNEKTLKDAGEFLQNNQFAMVVVVASEDMKGDNEQDRLLTEGRAFVVREYLVHNFKFDDTKVKTLGAGKSPDAPEGGQVEILVYSQTAAATNQ